MKNILAVSVALLLSGHAWALPPQVQAPPVQPGGTNGQVQFNFNGQFGGLSNTQLTADINPFTSSLNGAVPTPASALGATYYLNAAGGWSVPAGGGGGCTTNCTFTNPTITGGSLSGVAVGATSLSNAGQNLSQFLGSPYRQPTANDDVTRGIYPSMVWRSNNATWVNISAGQGAAIWQKVEQLPLPADALGLYVSAATINAAGTGYAANDLITLEGGVVIKVLTVSGGVPQTISVTTPNMYGVCSPTTTAAAQLVTSGSGTGATFNLTIQYPTIYAVRRVSSCYTGNILRVTNSVTTQTKDIGYLADNSMDFATAKSFGSGAAQMEQYANYNDGPTPNVAIWYDQGGNPSPNNATQATVAQQPTLFAGRKFGNSVAVMFNAQGSAASGAPYASAVSLTIPSGVTVASANAALIFGGGDVTAFGGLPYLNCVGCTGTHTMGMVEGGNPVCYNTNTAGSGDTQATMAPEVTETPQVYTCAFVGGNSVVDSSLYPSPNGGLFYINYTAGSTYGITATTGSTCPLTANHTATYTSTAGQTVAQTVAGVTAAINADATFQQAGITAQTALWPTPNSINQIGVFQPVGAGCTFAVSGSGGPSTGSNGSGWNFAGGAIGQVWNQALTGQVYAGIVAVVPWAMTVRQIERFRQSIHSAFEIDGHPGVLVNVIGASENNGDQTAFMQDYPSLLPKLLGRDDVVVNNKAGTGQQLVQVAATWATNGSYASFSGPLLYYTTGKSTNNVCLIPGEPNSLSASGSSATEYSAIQQIAGFCHAAGWKVACSGNYLAGYGATKDTELTLLQGLLTATPGNCDVVFNPTTIPQFSIPYPGPYNWPYFEQHDSGLHFSAMGNELWGSIAAEVLRGMIQ